MTTPTAADLRLFHENLVRNANEHGCWRMRMHARVPLERGGYASAFKFVLYTEGITEDFDQRYYIRGYSCYYVRRYFKCFNPAHVQYSFPVRDPHPSINDIRADFRRGIHIRDIAKTHNATITRIMNYTRGIKSGKQRKSELNQQVAALMWINGRDIPTIAKHLSVNRMTVYAMLRRSGEYLTEKEFEESRCSNGK